MFLFIWIYFAWLLGFNAVETKDFSFKLFEICGSRDFLLNYQTLHEITQIPKAYRILECKYLLWDLFIRHTDMFAHLYALLLRKLPKLSGIYFNCLKCSRVQNRAKRALFGQTHVPSWTCLCQSRCGVQLNTIYSMRTSSWKNYPHCECSKPSSLLLSWDPPYQQIWLGDLLGCW